MANPFPNPLLDLHRQAEADLQSYGDTPIVLTFGEPQLEYAAIRKACGLMDLPQRGILELTGKDRLPFLNNLLTNQTFDKQSKQGMPVGQGVYAFLLNSKNGRIITDMNVLERGDRTLLEMEARLVEPVRQALDRYLFSEQVKFAVRLGDLHQIALHGPGARDVLAGVLPAEPPELKPLESAAVSVIGHEAVLWRDDPAGSTGYTLILPLAAVEPVWMHLVTMAGQASETDPGRRALRPVGWAAFNTARIEAGRPLFAIDFDETVLPAETGLLDRAVSFTKGCYPGQEIVARMHARGQLARQTAGVRMDGNALPVAGTQVMDEKGNTVGAVTSSTLSPLLSSAPVCLAMLKKPSFNVGTRLQIPAEGQRHAGTVVELPFVR